MARSPANIGEAGLAYILWPIMQMMMFVSLVTSLLSLGSSLIIAKFSNPTYYILSAFEVIRITLTGWMFFSIYIRPGQDGLLPPLATRISIRETIIMFAGAFYTLSWRIAVIQTWAHLIMKSDTPAPGTGLIILFYVTIVLGTVLLAVRQVGRSSTTAPTIVTAKQMTKKAEVLRKIERRLTESEQEILESSLYKNDQLSKASIQNLVRVIWTTIVITLIIAITQELFALL
jgi:hypothetical protein